MERTTFVSSEGIGFPSPRPCPFCGRKDIRQTWNDDGKCTAMCFLCHACGPEARTQESAFDLWNIRYEEG